MTCSLCQHCSESYRMSTHPCQKTSHLACTTCCSSASIRILRSGQMPGPCCGIPGYSTTGRRYAALGLALKVCWLHLPCLACQLDIPQLDIIHHDHRASLHARQCACLRHCCLLCETIHPSYMAAALFAAYSASLAHLQTHLPCLTLPHPMAPGICTHSVACLNRPEGPGGQDGCTCQRQQCGGAHAGSRSRGCCSCW